MGVELPRVVLGRPWRVDDERVEPSDEVVDDKGVRLLVDPKAVLFLLGTEMDYKVDKLAAQFVFNNPNQTSACAASGV